MAKKKTQREGAPGGAKRGPKPKVGPTQEAQVYAVLRAGGSLADAADVLGVARSTLQARKAADAKFRAGVDRAAAKGKVRLLRKVGKASAWQAAAWMLERKWGSEFGKRDTVRHVGPDGDGPVKTETKHTFDHDGFARLYDAGDAAPAAAGGNGHAAPVPDRN